MPSKTPSDNHNKETDSGEPVANHWFCPSCVITIRCTFETWGYIPDYPPCPICHSPLQPVEEHPKRQIDREFRWRRPETVDEVARTAMSDEQLADEKDYIKQGGIFMDHPENGSAAELDKKQFEQEKKRITKLMKSVDRENHNLGTLLDVFAEQQS